MLYIILRGRWCDISILNVHVPTKDKIDDMKDRFYKELEYVFDKFPKYHMNILLGDFDGKVVVKTFSNEQLGMRVCTKLVIILQ
jgi:hypothetical protein